MSHATPHTSKSASRVVSFQSKESRTRAKGVEAAVQKMAANPVEPVVEAAPAPAPAPAPAAEISPALSPRVGQALRDDADATESLADIRGLLLGPVTRLHEARIEELLSIVEEADRGYQRAFKDLHTRADEMASTDELIKLDVLRSNEAIVSASNQQDLNLLHASKEMGHALKELSQKFEANFQKLFGELTHRIDTLATKSADDHLALTNSMNKRIDDLESATFANDERILAKLENQMATSEATLKAQRANDLNTIAKGLANFSDHVAKLPLPQG